MNDAVDKTAEVQQEEKIIPVTGKNSEALAKLAALPDPQILMRETPFHFKTPRSDKKNDKGEPVDDLGVVLKKRETVKLNIPLITFAGLVEALENDKQQQYVLDVLNDQIIEAARIQVSDELTPVNKQDELDLSKLTIAFLASQPKSERRGGGIAKEIWESWAKDYIAVMPAVAGKTVEAVGNAAKLFLAKFQPVKSNKKVLAVLKEQLALWLENSPNAEEYMECFEFLDTKVDALLQADDAALLANL